MLQKLSPSSPHQPINSSHMDKFSYAMGCMSFNDDLLDAALEEISGKLTRALGGVCSKQALTDLETETNWASAAHAMAFAGAVVNLDRPFDMLKLMTGVQFLDDEDLDNAKIVKGVMFDCLLAEKTLQCDADEAERVIKIRDLGGQVLMQYGYGGQHFSNRESL